MAATYVSLYTGRSLSIRDFQCYTWYLHTIECLAPSLFHRIHSAAQDRSALVCSEPVKKYLVYAQIIRGDGAVRSTITELLCSRQIFQQSRQLPQALPAPVSLVKKPTRHFFPIPIISTPPSCSSTPPPLSSSMSSSSSLPRRDPSPQVAPTLPPRLVAQHKCNASYELSEKIETPDSYEFRRAVSQNHLSSLMPAYHPLQAKRYPFVVGHTLAEALAQKALDTKNLSLMTAILPHLTQRQIFYRIEVNAPEGFVKALRRFAENPVAKALLRSHLKAIELLSVLADDNL